MRAAHRKTAGAVGQCLVLALLPRLSGHQAPVVEENVEALLVQHLGEAMHHSQIPGVVADERVIGRLLPTGSALHRPPVEMRLAGSRLAYADGKPRPGTMMAAPPVRHGAPVSTPLGTTSGFRSRGTPLPGTVTRLCPSVVSRRKLIVAQAALDHVQIRTTEGSSHSDTRGAEISRPPPGRS